MTLNEIKAILPIKTTGVSSKIIFITKFLKMIGADNDEYIEVTLRPFKNKIASCDETEEDEERTGGQRMTTIEVSKTAEILLKRIVGSRLGSGSGSGLHLMCDCMIEHLIHEEARRLGVTDDDLREA